MKLDKKEEKDNDIVVDENIDDSVVAEEAAGETIKKLRGKLKEVETKAQEYLAGWQRAKADMINARRQDEESKNEFIKYANENLVVELVPVLESFHMAMGNKEVWEKADKNWRTGVEYIANQLTKVLAENGLREINPKGLPFDPMRDEALSHEEVSDEKLNHVVLEVVQKGYELNGKALRAPKVRVGSSKSPNL